MFAALLQGGVFVQTFSTYQTLKKALNLNQRNHKLNKS